MLANRQQGSECGLRFMMKYAIHYLPLFGWYTFQVDFVFVFYHQVGKATRLIDLSRTLHVTLPFVYCQMQFS